MTFFYTFQDLNYYTYNRRFFAFFIHFFFFYFRDITYTNIYKKYTHFKHTNHQNRIDFNENVTCSGLTHACHPLKFANETRKNSKIHNPRAHISLTIPASVQNVNNGTRRTQRKQSFE